MQQPVLSHKSAPYFSKARHIVYDTTSMSLGHLQALQGHGEYNRDKKKKQEAQS